MRKSLKITAGALLALGALAAVTDGSEAPSVAEPAPSASASPSSSTPAPSPSSSSSPAPSPSSSAAPSSWHGFAWGVKDEIDELARTRECAGLQASFDRVDAGSARARDRGADPTPVLTYIDEKLRDAGCY